MYVQVPYVCIACKTSIRKGLALRRYLNPLGISAGSTRSFFWVGMVAKYGEVVQNTGKWCRKFGEYKGDPGAPTSANQRLLLQSTKALRGVGPF